MHRRKQLRVRVQGCANRCQGPMCVSACREELSCPERSCLEKKPALPVSEPPSTGCAGPAAPPPDVPPCCDCSSAETGQPLTVTFQPFLQTLQLNRTDLWKGTHLYNIGKYLSLDLFYFVNLASSCLLIPLQLTDSKLGSDELQHTPLASTSVNREFSPKCIRSAHSICCTVLQRWTATKHVMCTSLCGCKVYLVSYQCCIDLQVSSRGLPQKKKLKINKYGFASMQKSLPELKKSKGISKR